MTREQQPASSPDQPETTPAQHVAEAHNLLKGLREKLERHPELERAIEELEMALSKLTMGTGALL